MPRDPNESVYNFLRMINGELFNRLMDGDFDYEQDLAQIHSLLTQASELGSARLRGALNITLMLLYFSVGDFNEAFTASEVAIRAYESDPDPRTQLAVITVLSNQAEMFHDFGDVQGALDISSQVLLKLTDPEAYAMISGPHIYFANRGIYHLSNGDIDAAEELFLDVIAKKQQASSNYGHALFDTHRGLAHVWLMRGNLTKAYSAARLARDIATSEDDPTRLFYANATLAHITERDPEADTAPSHYYAAADEAARQIRSPMFRGVALLHECRYQRRQDNHAMAADFAELAREVFAAAAIAAFDDELR